MSEELVKAAFKGDVRRVVRLLEEGAEINFQGRVWTPLHAAIENEKFECVRELVVRGADLEQVSCEFTALAHAVDVAIDGTSQAGGRPADVPVEVVEYLLVAGAKPRPGLEVAAAYGNEKLMALLKLGANSGG